MTGTEVQWIRKSLVSSAILQAGVDVSDVIGVNDSYEIVDVIAATDGTGLAGGTLFQLYTDDAVGAAVFFSHAVASLGANATVCGKTATTFINRVIRAGKKILAKATAADCTGAGVVQLHIAVRRIVPSSRWAAAA